jgi:hypothetical protein
MVTGRLRKYAGPTERSLPRSSRRQLDCVDRVILNAYFGRGQFGGGLRIRWRALHGSDNHLDDNHLRRMAGRFSRRLRAWAKENKIPVAYSSPGERKHNLASEQLATHETKPGLFMILVSKAPALGWEAQMTGAGKLGQLVIKDPWPYVNHYSFHILDPDWGHLTIKMSGQPPFGAQVRLNGHEYVACQAQKAGVGFIQQDNCFTNTSNLADLAKVADTLSAPRTAERFTPTLRALDIYHLPLLCSGSGGAEEERLFIPIFGLPDGVQPPPAVFFWQTDGRDIPGAE